MASISSAATSSSAVDNDGSASVKFETVNADCALFIDKSPVLAGNAFTTPHSTALRLRYMIQNVENAPSALGFRIAAPFGDADQLDNENIGHGVSHSC